MCQKCEVVCRGWGSGPRWKHPTGIQCLYSTTREPRDSAIWLLPGRLWWVWSISGCSTFIGRLGIVIRSLHLDLPPFCRLGIRAARPLHHRKGHQHWQHLCNHIQIHTVSIRGKKKTTAWIKASQGITVGRRRRYCWSLFLCLVCILV